MQAGSSWHTRGTSALLPSCVRSAWKGLLLPAASVKEEWAYLPGR